MDAASDRNFKLEILKRLIFFGLACHVVIDIIQFPPW